MSAWNSPQFLTRLLKANASAEVEAIMGTLPIVAPDDYQWDHGDERHGEWQADKLHWLPVGLERGNSGRIKLAGEPMNPIAERLVNGMEALIELERLTELATNPSAPPPANPREAVWRYFGLPPLDEIQRMDAGQKREMEKRVGEVRTQLAIRLSYDKGDKEFAVTIRDKGMGQTAARMSQTLLSLGQSDKDDKPYLIGVFGQGGSSTFAASKYSIIVTRRSKNLSAGEDHDLGWSIVQKVHPKGRRGQYFAYLAAAEDGAVPRISAGIADSVGFERGAQFSHIRYDFGGSPSTIARMFYQALNHVLFNPVLPYELFAMKEKPDAMYGTASRLSGRVRQEGPQGTLDKAFTDVVVDGGL